MATSLIPGLIGHSAAALSGALGCQQLPGLQPGHDVEDGGRYYVAGTVAIAAPLDIPVRRRVRLICAVSGRLVREIWSDPATGEYRFEQVRIGPWLVIAHDYTASYNAAVADNIMGIPE